MTVKVSQQMRLMLTTGVVMIWYYVTEQPQSDRRKKDGEYADQDRRKVSRYCCLRLKHLFESALVYILWLGAR